ncbi:MAG TPA: HAD hydrolase-like protein [Patescibacteria group bacterium]|nr:HAD hydrolase-like protein [Patescibacteria group bacterium]
MIIFDFDGTLADSFKVMRELYNLHAADYGLRPVSDEGWEKVRRMRFGAMLKFTGIKPYQVPRFLNIGRQLLATETHRFGLYKGMDKVVEQLHTAGHQLYVLSTNSQVVVQAVVDKGNVTKDVTVLRSSKLFGKAQAIKRLLRQKRLSPDQTWIIGDEMRDIQAAKRSGIHSLAVTWGFHPEEMLAPNHPDAIAYTPEDIVKILNDYDDARTT